MKKLIVIGAGGHAKVVADIAMKLDRPVLGFLDDAVSEIWGMPVLGGIEDALRYRDECAFVLAVGSNALRHKLDRQYPLEYATLIHPSAQIGCDVTIGAGTVVMANAAINPSAHIGRHCIINTGAVVEHDNRIAGFVHVSPGATLAGTVCIGAQTHVGCGAVIKNNTSVCAGCIIGAGAVVVKDITQAGTYAGVPAKRIK